MQKFGVTKVVFLLIIANVNTKRARTIFLLEKDIQAV